MPTEIIEHGRITDERAFRLAFGDGHTEISVYGPRSTAVMQWGVERNLVERVGGGSLYRLTDLGRAEMRHG